MKIQRTTAEIAALVGGRLDGPGDATVETLCLPELAGPDDMVVVFRKAMLATAAASRAGCILLSEGLELPASETERALIVVPDADFALDRLVLASAGRSDGEPAGVHETAIIGEGAEISADAMIGPWVLVGAGARIGARSRLGPGVHLGVGSAVGADCRLDSHVVLGDRCTMGDRVAVHSGTVIGAEGFGFRQDAAGRHVKVPQVGNVEIGDDVELGALCTVDRARFDTTRIGNGCKLDDHVHVGHNVQMGEHCAVAGMVAFAGSVRLGPRCMVGGSAGVDSGVTLGEGTLVGANSIVTKDTRPGSFVMGVPARPRRRWAREQVELSRLGDLIERVRKLEGRTDDRDA
ncbi:MAG: UDP-3-O-(3-hydroxymyristoyl)glucosamine N-acyltransferase [Planctomycetota bacterium]|jgi:UDP-3-O-[3-hydroxymyristoyl] glucosamine N-acyltransferase